jgi:hypothetical protein
VPQNPAFGTWNFFLNPTHSRPGVGLNVPLNRFAQFKASLGQVVHLLEVEPELRAVAEELRQAERRVGRDRSAAMNDVANARGAWRLCGMLLRFDVGSEDGIHARQVSFAARPEPFDHIVVEAQVYGGFSLRHNHPRGAPELRSQGFRLRGVRVGPVFPKLTQVCDLTQRMSHDSRFPVHLCSLSGR